jgi:tRNA G18 (ribose-2'-O)-methylase SpoU
MIVPHRDRRPAFTTGVRSWGGRFIAESQPLVKRLLASDYEVESVLVDQEYAEESRVWIPEDVVTYIVPHQLVDELLGFNFHRGFLGCGIRKPLRQARDVLREDVREANWISVLAVGIQDPENLGVIIRTCAGLGIRTIILGPGTADPLSRRVLRVSMGAALKVDLVDSPNITEFLDIAKQQQVHTIATSLQMPSTEITEVTRSGPSVVLFGNEAYGLPDAIQSAADQRINIRMDLNTDSLNVSVAAGIVLHYLARIAK